MKIGKLGLERAPSKKAIIGLVFGVIVFSYLGWRAYQGIQQLARTGVHITISHLLLSLGCQSVGVLLAAAIWSDILQQVGVEAGYFFDLQVFCASAVARKVPGTIWYALGRLALYERTRWPRRPVIIALIIEAVMIALAGLVAFGISLGAGLVRIPGISSAKRLSVVVAILVAVATMAHPFIIRYLVKKMRTNEKGESDGQPISMHSGDTWRWLIGEIGVVTLGAAVSFFSMKSIDVSMPIPFASVLGAWGLAVAVGPVAMWLPGDIGLKDGFMYVVLSPVISGPLAAVATLAWRLWVTLLELLFGLLSAVNLSRSISSVGEE